MRRLMLLRHAKSDWPEKVDDHDRPLAKRGQRTGPMMGTYMAKQKLLPDLAIVSTARRAQETWNLVHEALGCGVEQQDERRIYEAAAGSILDVIRKTKADVRVLLLVGHNPGFQELALKLVKNAHPLDLAHLQQKYPTAGLVVIDLDIARWSAISENLGRLERFETPKSIDKGAGK